MPTAADGTLTTSAGKTGTGNLVGTGTGALVYAIVVPSLDGTARLTNSATGSFTYTPNANFVGTDRFQFTVTDSVGTSNPATMTIQVVATTDTATPMELGRSPVTWAEAQNFNTPSYSGHELLAANSPWFAAFRQDISALPADPHSDAMLARMINAGGTLNATDTSGSFTPSTWNWYTMPINIVSGTVKPLGIPGTWTYDPASSGPYLLPPAPVDFEGDASTVYPTKWTDSGDHHLLVLQRDETTGGPGKLWEYYQPTVTRDNAGNMTAVSGASYRVFDLKDGEDPPSGTNSTDAAGLPIMPLLINYNEVATGAINHVIRGELNNSDIRPYYVWPARTSAGAWNSNGIPYGAILRIKQSWWNANADTVLGVGTQARVIGEAMRKYGIMIADGTGGSSIEVSGIADFRWSSDFLQRLDAIPVSAFEVVQLQPTVAINGPSTLATGVSGTWTLSFTNPGELGPVTFNIYNYTNPAAPTLEGYHFALLGAPDHLSVTASYTFSTPGTYRIMPYQSVYMDFDNAGFTITVQ